MEHAFSEFDREIIIRKFARLNIEDDSDEETNARSKLPHTKLTMKHLGHLEGKELDRFYQLVAIFEPFVATSEKLYRAFCVAMLYGSLLTVTQAKAVVARVLQASVEGADVDGSNGKLIGRDTWDHFQSLLPQLEDLGQILYSVASYVPS